MPKAADRRPRVDGQRPKTEDRRPETEYRRLKTEGRRPKTEYRRPKAEARRPKTEDRTPTADDRRPKTEDCRPKTDDRRPKTEGRRPKTEDLRPNTEDRRLKTEYRIPNTYGRRPKTEDRRPTADVGAHLFDCVWWWGTSILAYSQWPPQDSGRVCYTLASPRSPHLPPITPTPRPATTHTVMNPPPLPPGQPTSPQLLGPFVGCTPPELGQWRHRECRHPSTRSVNV
jgi:hypothetical protein